jgi:membrane protein DedA with SNARE-associated domain
MTTPLECLVRHAELILLLYVFAEQVGIPVPAVPVLLTVGALVAAGKVSLPAVLAVSIAASLAADLIWYLLGRLYGARVLQALGKISLRLDSCARRAEELFRRHGARALLFSKFVPGLSMVAPPFGAVAGIGLARFSCYSSLAALLWAGAWMLVGVVTAGALDRATAVARHVITLAVLAAALVAAAYLVCMRIERRRFGTRLRGAKTVLNDGQTRSSWVLGLLHQHARARLRDVHAVQAPPPAWKADPPSSTCSLVRPGSPYRRRRLCWSSWRS